MAVMRVVLATYIKAGTQRNTHDPRQPRSRESHPQAREERRPENGVQVETVKEGEVNGTNPRNR